MNKITVLLILFIVFAGYFITGGSDLTKNLNLSPKGNQSFNIDNNFVNNNSSQNLQLKTFNGVEITPPPVIPSSTFNPSSPLPNSSIPSETSTPIPSSSPVALTNYCSHETGVALSLNGNGLPVNPGDLGPCLCQGDIVTCQNNKCVANVIQTMAGDSTVNEGCSSTQDAVCDGTKTSTGVIEAPTDGTFCVMKPVIYLYPTKPTNISVKIQTSGKVVISDPLYENGWDNVLAFPSGNLIYKNKVYTELFYETDVKNLKPVSGGIIVEKKYVKDSLYSLTSKLGLIKIEQDELVNWWTPRLQNLNKTYILISLVDEQTKNETDKVLISPEPDTRIEFLLYFKGLDKKQNIPNLNLPPTPKRIGFTEVEWGGTIDSN